MFCLILLVIVRIQLKSSPLLISLRMIQSYFVTIHLIDLLEHLRLISVFNSSFTALFLKITRVGFKGWVLDFAVVMFRQFSNSPIIVCCSACVKNGSPSLLFAMEYDRRSWILWPTLLPFLCRTSTPKYPDDSCLVPFNETDLERFSHRVTDLAGFQSNITLTGWS